MSRGRLGLPFVVIPPCMASQIDNVLATQWHFVGRIALKGFPKIVAALVAYSRMPLLESVTIDSSSRRNF